MESHLWDLDSTSGVSKIQTWKLLGHDFQDVGPQFWDLDFRTGGGGFHDPGPGNFLGHGFQDVGSHLWDPKIQTWKLLGHDFQDVGPQFWNLDFALGAVFSMTQDLEIFRSWIFKT